MASINSSPIVGLKELGVSDDLIKLDNRLNEFNLFEALGATRVELRHSDFLGFLLSPKASHGLGDRFVKSLFSLIAKSTEQGKPSKNFELNNLSDINDLEVHREWQNIDLLLLSEENHLVVVIENKVKSSERSNQLSRYKKIVGETYRGWRKLFLFLTPSGEKASDSHYLSISYTQVANAISSLLLDEGLEISFDVRLTLEHYKKTIRRFFMPDPDTQKIAHEINKKHWSAIEFIIKYREGIRAEIKNFLIDLIERKNDLVLDTSTTAYIRFFPTSWNNDVLRACKDWTDSNLILLCEFRNSPSKLALHIVIGPGPEELRNRLYELGNGENPFLTNPYKVISDHASIYTQSLYKETFFHENDIDALKAKIEAGFKIFVEDALPEINRIVEEIL